MNENIYDGLDSWREENGMRTTKGTVKHYEGGCEYDPTYEAIKAYEEEQKRKQAKNKPEENTPL